MLSEEIKKLMDKGVEGLSKGLPFGFNKLDGILPGIQQGNYYLIGGETSSGKTAFTDNSFLYSPVDWVLKHGSEQGIDVNIHYYSLEIDKRMKAIKGLCRKIFLETEGKLLLDVNYVLSRGKHHVSQEHYDAVMSRVDYLDLLEEKVKFYDEPIHPTGIFKNTVADMKQRGTEFIKEIVEEKFDDFGNSLGKKKQKLFEGYRPENPNCYNLLIIDHIALMRKESGLSTKANIDKMSSYLIELRNKYNVTPVVVQQLNRNLSSSDRFKLDMVDPQLSDFKDTSCTQDDANVVLTLFSPNRYDMKNYHGYNISKLKDTFRSLSVLKNRDGQADVRVGLEFVGALGLFRDMQAPVDPQKRSMF